MTDIEAIARALCLRTELNPDAMVAGGVPMTVGFKTVILAFGGLDPAWKLFEEDARAALKCIINLGYLASSP